MPSGRRYPRRSSRGPKRQTMWFGAAIDPAFVAPGVNAFTAVLANLAEDNKITLKGVTILRIIGSLRVNSTDATFSAEYFAGIKTVPEESATTLPDPATDLDADWMWWDRQVALPAEGKSNYFSLDIKAKRKFRRPDDKLLFLMSNDDASQSIEYAWGIRILLALP